MDQKSLGLIETYGLVAGIEAADAAVKSANVKLVGYEFARGAGMTTIKLLGDVGAVQAAVSAAQVAAEKVGSVASVKVIPRPASGIEGMIRNEDTVGYVPTSGSADKKEEKSETTSMAKPSEKKTETPKPVTIAEKKQEPITQVTQEKETKVEDKKNPNKKKKASKNLKKNEKKEPPKSGGKKDK